MRRARIVLLCCISLVCVAKPAAAASFGEYAAACGIKLGHGLGSILWAPIETVATPVAFAVDQDREARAFTGFLQGIFIGPINGSTRATVGAGEVITFLFTSPNTSRPFYFRPMSTWKMLPSEEELTTPPSRGRAAPQRDVQDAIRF